MQSLERALVAGALDVRLQWQCIEKGQHLVLFPRRWIGAPGGIGVRRPTLSIVLVLACVLCYCCGGRRNGSARMGRWEECDDRG